MTHDDESGDCHHAGQKPRRDGIKDQCAYDWVHPVDVGLVSGIVVRLCSHLFLPDRLFHNKTHKNPASVMSATHMEIKVASISALGLRSEVANVY